MQVFVFFQQNLGVLLDFGLETGQVLLILLLFEKAFLILDAKVLEDFVKDMEFAPQFVFSIGAHFNRIERPQNLDHIFIQQNAHIEVVLLQLGRLHRLVEIGQENVSHFLVQEREFLCFLTELLISYDLEDISDLANLFISIFQILRRFLLLFELNALDHFGSSVADAQLRGQVLVHRLGLLGSASTDHVASRQIGLGEQHV